MNRRQWHLDTEFGPGLFAGCWGSAAHSNLLDLFRCVDTAETPILSTLPPGIDPAGAAIAAAMYFLPGLGAPPTPHCRIALYPGLHFQGLLKTIGFPPLELHEAGRVARAMRRGIPRIQGPFEKLFKKRNDGGVVHFHWLFKCQTVWTVYFKLQSKAITPRGYFGEADGYESSLDLYLGENLKDLDNPKKPFDLLIYCPYFHAGNFEDHGGALDDRAKQIRSFSAHRKLILARSPYDYWADECEERYGLRGIGIPARIPIKQDIGPRVSGIEFEVVDQFLSVEDAYLLFRDLREAFKKPEADRHLVQEARSIAKRLFVRLDPQAGLGELELEEIAGRFKGILDSLPLRSDGPTQGIVSRIMDSISKGAYTTKLKTMQRLFSRNEKFEIWVSRDADKRALETIVGDYKGRVQVTVADGKSVFGARKNVDRVIIPRVDRSQELNLVSYLGSRDIVIISAWEAVTRMDEIMRSWEKSEKWRENAEISGVIRRASADEMFADPVLDLANYVDKVISEVRRQYSDSEGAAASSKLDSGWWDERAPTKNSGEIFNRSELITNTGELVYACRELTLEGEVGIFIRAEDEVQIIGQDEDGEIADIVLSKVRPGMFFLLFKDAERSSFFDLVMNQLEKSAEYTADVRNVKNWKNELRIYSESHGIRATDISRILKTAGSSVDPISVRSWMQGSTMAPRGKELLRLVIETLGLGNVEVEKTYNSVKRLRNIAITLGKALNHVILHRSLDEIGPRVREALIDAGVDIEELASAVESRKIIAVSDGVFKIEGKNVRKIFNI